MLDFKCFFSKITDAEANAELAPSHREIPVINKIVFQFKQSRFNFIETLISAEQMAEPLFSFGHHC